MRSIFDDIFSHDNLKPALLEELQTLVISKSVVKGQVLLRENEITRKIFYVKQGLLRSYVIDTKGKEHIFAFAPEGWIISDVSSRIQNKPAQLYIDALEDSEIEIVDQSVFEKVEASYSNASGVAVKKLMRRMSAMQNRIIMLISATALERYQDFEKTYPNIVQRVPQKMIASYLGITPEALSKIRGDYARKK